MKKIFILVIFLSAFIIHSNAQLTKIWDYRYGGNQDDFTGGIIATADGGALAWGYSYSGMTGDKSEPLKGLQDYWVVKVAVNGIMEWNKSFGGANFYNYMTCVMETQDHGFILGGYTPANSGIDKSEDSRGGNDYWIIRIDNAGTKLWDKTYGTNKDDFMTCVYATSDGGFLLGGITTGDISFDKTTVGQGHLDYWIIKTDVNGQYEWDKDYGGTKDDYMSRVVETFDGGFYLAGVSYSNMSGDKTEDSKGSTDFWIIKTDNNGNYLWDRDYGSSGTEGTLSNFSFMDITLDNGAILATTTNGGISGDKTVANWGGIYNDFWAVRLDSNGNKLWDQHYGGAADEDEFYNVWHTADGGFLISGSSYSGISGDKSESNGGQAEQAWCIKVDGNGNKIWDKTLHTEDHNEGGMCTETTGGCIIFDTYTNANAGGDKTEDSWSNSYDYFFAKFCFGSLLPTSSFEASDTAGCEIFCTSFTDQSTNNPNSWLWNFPGGNPASSTDQNPSNICYSLPGSYDVTLITSNSAGSDTVILNDYISVYSLPSVTITQSNDTLSCSAATSYQWYLNGNIIPGATDQQLIITQPGDYSVVITDATGCTATNNIDAGLLLPVSDFNAATTSGCLASCFDFTNASLNASTYQWSFPGGNPSSSALQNPSNICYSNPGVYDVTLIASSTFASDTLTLAGYITIFTPVVFSVAQNGNVLTCNPAASNYQWFLNGNAIAGATSQSISITDTGIYSVETIDDNGCSSLTDINVTSVPSPAFSAADTTVCEKFCLNFFDSSTNNPTAWQWIFPGGDPSFSTLQNPINICYNNPGVYDVTLITTNASGEDTLVQLGYITVYPTPALPVISQTGYVLTSTAAPAYQWQFNNVDIPGATNQSYTVTQTGYYTVIITDGNGCTASATSYVLITGIDEIFSDSDVLIYPEPSDGNFIVEWFNGLMVGQTKIEVYNELGQVVYSSAIHGEDGHLTTTVDLRNLTGGVYILMLKTEKEEVKKKIMIVN